MWAVPMMRDTMRRASRAALIIAALIFGACSGVAPTASPAPTPAPTATPTLAPTAPPTAAPTATAIPTTALSPIELLISYAPADLRDTCHEYRKVYDAELASIECGPADLPFDYSLFDSSDEMDAAFDDDVAGADTPPQPNGKCNEGNYLEPYDVDGRVGRVNCYEHTSSSTGSQYHVIEWTDEDLLVIGYISNRVDLHTWDELIDFWLNEAGPYAL
jgi:hypothetical protein